MIYNVAQLLKSSIGATQDVLLDPHDNLELPDGEARLAGDLSGKARLHRTNQNIYVDGKAHVPVYLDCSRCLNEFVTTLTFPLREEFYPTVDVDTGLPIPKSENEMAFAIDDHHQLDLREAIRQNLVLAIPSKPLCREGCKGLCPECGRDLNVEPHTHETVVADERFAALRNLFEQA